MKLHNVVLVCLFTAMLAACSKPTDATKENFAKVIGAGLSGECAAPVVIDNGLSMNPTFSSNQGYMVNLTNGEYPATVLWVKPAGLLQQLDALVSAGMLTRKDLPDPDVGHRAPNYLLRGHQQQRQYALTDEGRKALLGKMNFCAAHYKLDEVVNFTAPASAFGQTVTTVTISVSAQDVPAWAHSGTLAAAFPDLAPALQARGKILRPLTNWFTQTPASTARCRYTARISSSTIDRIRP
jgi:hypothetical protein